MQVSIPHKFSRADAVTRVKQALDEARPKMAGQAVMHEERWDGDTLNFDVEAQGQRVSGTVEVTDTTFEINAKLPLMLRMFEGRIEQVIREQSAKMLG